MPNMAIGIAGTCSSGVCAFRQRKSSEGSYGFLIATSIVLLTGLASAQSTVRFQAGRILVDTKNRANYYNASYETSITTQYIAPWNNQNGVTYFWGSTGPDFTYTLGDYNAGSEDKFRTLIRFDKLNNFLPAKTVIQSAELTVTFMNWQDPVQVQGCFMTRPWDYQPSGPRWTTRCCVRRASDYASTGWRYSLWNGAASVPWTQPGGWADCSPDVNISFVVPVNEYYGYVTLTIALDAAKVAGWLAKNGSANYGLLFRATNGTISFVTSQVQTDNPSLHRPSLNITYKTSGKQSKPKYPVKLGRVPRTWWVDPAGSDELNGGFPDSPFKSLGKAVFEAWPGDIIHLKNGTYAGSVQITRPRITIRSAPGHWATIASPMNDPQSAVTVLSLYPGADNGVISDVEIVGGFYYGIMFMTDWENYYTIEERVAQGSGPSHWVIRNVRIHDTGSSAVKLVMKARNNTFTNCEMYNTGARTRISGHGIMAVQAYEIAVRDCYFHDLPGAAVHLAGGTAGAVIERNFIARTGFGLNLGFTMDYEYMDPINNPKLYESINVIARNNIITAASQAGINVWAGRNVIVAHNTIWQAQENTQSCILVNSYSHDDAPSGSILTSCANLTVWANLLVRSATARAGPVLQIRADGLDPATPFVSNYNIYYDQKGLGLIPFAWGKGAMLEDERSGTPFVGNATGWAQHCSVALNQAKCDINSLEADPKLDASFTPLACSPAKASAAPKLPSGVALVSDDFSGRARPAGQFDSGAVQSNAKGTPKAIPPVPTAFAAYSTYSSVGLGPVFDKNWPYEFWAGRECKDIYVDAVNGKDNQEHNYESEYKFPFKTIAAALAALNQCDRILLKGGQNHTGGFGIFAPNVTIRTNPADLPASRARVVCSSATQDNPCIRTGDGLYGGAAAITLADFDVVMTGSASGSCIHLNEGTGSGTSAYWAFYLAARGLKPTLSYIQNMALTNCGRHGIKLSTFVQGVVMQGLTIAQPEGTGIEVRGGGDLTIRGNTILSPGDTAIRLGGGARNVLVERNLIKDFGGRGILLGSDNTEVEYMDVDWARARNDWHDNINTIVRNNILDGGAGAGVAFYSARDAVVVHNTLLNVAATMQAGVLLNVSPKQLGPTLEVGPPNVNITFKNNIVSLGGKPTTNLMVEARILQGSMVSSQLVVLLPNGTCRAAAKSRHRVSSRRLQSEIRPIVTMQATKSSAFQDLDDDFPKGESAGIPQTAVADDGAVRIGATSKSRRRSLASFVDAAVNAPGEQGRNPDGSCPIFPADNAWHLDVSSMRVSPLNDVIKSHIGGGNLHPDFGGGERINGQRVLYGIPFVFVDSSRGTPMVPIDLGAYEDESDISPGGYPFPPDAPVEGAYPNCPDSRCGGDRHVLVVDNATCLLYETFRSFPPGVTGTGRWLADVVAIFNLSRNAVGRPLGWTSADAAGLPIYPGLVKWEEVVVKGVIDHAIRFTGPNSRAAYAPPATHFAPHGYTGADAPYMGMRVRLNASYDCSPLAPAAQVFCTALKKYGGIFADNGSPWFFTGEANSKWDSVLDQLSDISRIPSSALEVLDSGCICTDARCTNAECNGIPEVDPSAVPSYPAISSVADMSFANNVYFKVGSTTPVGRYVDRRTPPPQGAGYDGGLAGWQAYTGGESGSAEADPQLDAATYKPQTGSIVIGKAVQLPVAISDYYGSARDSTTGMTDVGAVLSAETLKNGRRP